MNVFPVFIIFEMLLTYPEDSWNLHLMLKTKKRVQVISKAFNSAFKCKDSQSRIFREV